MSVPRSALLPLAAPAQAGPGLSLWRLSFVLDQPVPLEVLAVLSPEERQRHGRYLRLADRVRFAMTRWTLRALLAERLRADPARLVFAAGPHGKPEIQEHPELQFNVSHSGGHALLALSESRPVGVDIEQRAPGPVGADLMGVLTLAERTHCAGGRDAAAFYDIWAGKEAVLKAWGEGLGDALARLSAVPGPDGGFALALADQPCQGTRAWRLNVRDAGYSAALAVMAPAPA